MYECYFFYNIISIQFVPIIFWATRQQNAWIFHWIAQQDLPQSTKKMKLQSAQQFFGMRGK